MTPRGCLWAVSKSILFRFDPEAVHLAAVRLLVLMNRLFGPAAYPLIRIVSGSPSPARSSLAAVRVMNMDFQSPLGLAAGFDKNAEVLPALPHLGFGFAEIGTVTPVAQPGNERPRVFRDPSRQALFNCMGFNGWGAPLVARNLERARKRLPSSFRVGVNIGKNKATPLEDAPADYAKAVAPFRGLADYLVINVSSPNTPGLRQLQTVEALKPILDSVLSETAHWAQRPPVFLKLAPEVEGDSLRLIVETMDQAGVGGWVLTNTLGGQLGSRAGGWSGGPLTEISRRRLLETRSLTRLPIISAGGIMDSQEALLRLRSGANLIQIYTGWIFGGFGFPGEVHRVLSKALSL